jgi:hypothetical protein
MSKEKKQNVEAIYPLSPMQEGMLFHTLYAPASGVYFQQVVCTFGGGLDAAALRRAWQGVVERHAVLRTAFVWERRDKPLQVVRRRAVLPWEEQDWRGLGPEEQEARLEAYLAADRERGFDPAKSPLMRCALMRVGDDRYEFVWSHHHILLDGWSISLLLGEVFMLYEAARGGRELQLEPPRPYRDYILWLKKQSLGEAENFWRRTLAEFNAPTPLPARTQRRATSGETRSYAERQGCLSSSATLALQTLARRHQLTMNIV